MVCNVTIVRCSLFIHILYSLFPLSLSCSFYFWANVIEALTIFFGNTHTHTHHIIQIQKHFGCFTILLFALFALCFVLRHTRTQGTHYRFCSSVEEADNEQPKNRNTYEIALCRSALVWRTNYNNNDCARNKNVFFVAGTRCGYSFAITRLMFVCSR